MGVHGWQKFLIDNGWIPDPSKRNACCSKSPWRDPSAIDQPLFTKRLCKIPPNSTFLIDGYGLALHLQPIAYARYIAKVVNIRKKGTFGRRNICCASVKALNEAQRNQLLPQYLPLQILADLTKEYVDALNNNGIDLVVYWDGEKRFALKQETDDQRQERFLEEWDRLQQYCRHGVIPNADTACQWYNLFPRSRLSNVQIISALAQKNIPMKFCEEEADRILAQAASYLTNGYVLGNDTDFCFFPGVNYIPLSTLDIKNREVTASVIRRDKLCKEIGLKDENQLIELAILCGNDYLRDPASANLDFYSRCLDQCIEHILSQGLAYRVTASSDATNKVLTFIRALYTLDSNILGQYTLVDKILNNTEEISEDDFRPRVPDRYLVNAKKCRKATMNAINALVESTLQTFIQDGGASGDWVINEAHLRIFRCTKKWHKRSTTKQKMERPKWENMYAAFFIEKIISTATLSIPSSGAAVFRLFDSWKYHMELLGEEHARKAALSSVALSLDPHECVPSQGNALTQVRRIPAIPYVASPDEPSPRISHSQVNIPVTSRSLEPKAFPTGAAEETFLPVDEHENTILRAVRRNRVTVVQAETGAGKSSRVPCMLLKAKPVTGCHQARLFVSQPRRIAARALVERLRKVEPELRDCFALRLGHGVREFESNNTRAWFVTTGYLVRLLANCPGNFARIDYIIVDEAHERSVDNDLLCLLCKRLLQTNETIRIILMSATLASDLYREYFNVEEQAIFVGSRRFPVKEVFIEELARAFPLSPQTKQNILNITCSCENLKCRGAPPFKHMEMLYSVATQLTMEVGKPGSSVLIFVSGMSDIFALFEAIEELKVPCTRYKCIPIHSDIAEEDQMEAFRRADDDEVKVIIATNAAESSLTLPDVDNVICLGLCKRIEYNDLSHRQFLTSCWISKASATQRAGRTGRVRPGTVYRLYTRENYERDMADFEPGEIVRTPLDSVILELKTIMNEGEITSTFLDCIEPPKMSTIDRSLENLYQSDFITAPSDLCDITNLGTFVSMLGIDLTLGSLIGLGIQFGVASEAVQLAGVLTFPQSPWIRSNPFTQQPKVFNMLTKKNFVSQCDYDGGLQSEPFAIMNMLFEYETVTPGTERKAFLSRKSLHIDYNLQEFKEKENFTETILLCEQPATARRGVGERRCGLWNARVTQASDEEGGKRFHRFLSHEPLTAQFLCSSLGTKIENYAKERQSVVLMVVDLQGNSKNLKRFSCRLLNCEDEVTEQDLRDLFSVSEIRNAQTKSELGEQTLFFPAGSFSEADNSASSLFQNIPEGVRLISVLLAKRSRRGIIYLEDEIAARVKRNDDENDEEKDYRAIFPQRGNLGARWKRLSHDQCVLTNGDCVQATAVPAEGMPRVYCCAANSLELNQSGQIKVEGLTILPPGPLFVLLCRLSFGLLQNDVLQYEELFENSMTFVRQWTEKDKVSADMEKDWSRRIALAIAFHEQCKSKMGESLVCFPDKVKALCAIFDGVNGYSFGSWNADDNPLTLKNLKRSKEPKHDQQEDEHVSSSRSSSVKEEVLASPLIEDLEAAMESSVSSHSLNRREPLQVSDEEDNASLDDEEDRKEKDAKCFREMKQRLHHVWEAWDEDSTVDDTLFASALMIEALGQCSDHLSIDALNEIVLACHALKRERASSAN